MSLHKKFCSILTTVTPELRQISKNFLQGLPPKLGTAQLLNVANQKSQCMVMLSSTVYKTVSLLWTNCRLDKWVKLVHDAKRENGEQKLPGCRTYGRVVSVYVVVACT
jgi:hypothetical protein